MVVAMGAPEDPTYIINTTTIVQVCIVVIIGVAVIVANVLIIATLWTMPGKDQIPH
jgi:hypothetical protein